MDIRKKLEAEIGTLPEPIWDLLEDDGYPQDYERANCDADRRETWALLKRRARKLLSLSRPNGVNPKPAPQAVRESRPAANRSYAMSALLAADARTLPEVRHFRREVLQDRLMTHEEAVDWIEARGAKNGEHVDIFLDGKPCDDLQRALDSIASRSASNLRRESRLLDYGKPDSKWVCLIPFAKDGELARLSALADSLCRRYHWRKASAVIFVLTGLAPLIGAQIGWQVGGPGPRRITLDIPDWYHEEDVVAAYRQARASMLGKHRQSRTLSERTAALVVFVCDSLDERGLPLGGWEAIRKEWNSAHPEWAYQSDTRIASDFRRAEKRLWES